MLDSAYFVSSSSSWKGSPAGPKVGRFWGIEIPQTAEATDRKPVVTQRGDRIDPLTEVQAKRLRQIQRPEPQHAIDASGDQHLPTEETAETQSVDLTHVGAWVRSFYLTGTEIPDREVPFLRAAGNHT